jgi:hypothetical protein
VVAELSSYLLTQKSLILFSNCKPILANGAKVVDNAGIMLPDITRSLLTTLFVTTAQNRFSAAGADVMRVDEKQGLGSHAECGHWTHLTADLLRDDGTSLS